MIGPGSPTYDDAYWEISYVKTYVAAGSQPGAPVSNSTSSTGAGVGAGASTGTGTGIGSGKPTPSAGSATSKNSSSSSRLRCQSGVLLAILGFLIGLL